MLTAANKGKIYIIVANGIEGNVAVNIVKIEPHRALKLFTSVAGCKVIEDGNLKIIVNKKTDLTEFQTPLSVVDDVKFKAGSIRKAEIRSLLKNLFIKAKTDVIISHSVTGTCLVRSDELLVSELINGLIKANQLKWTTIDGIPYIVSKAEFKIIK